MLWHEDTQFHALYVYAGEQSTVLHRTPKRNTIVETKRDHECATRSCKCYKVPREDGHECLRGSFNNHGIPFIDYVENDRGARSWLTSHSVVPLLPKEEKQ